MSDHTNKVTNHSVHDNLKKVQENLETITLIKDKSIEAIETLARITEIIENFAIALETDNVNLISISWLDESSNALNYTNNYLVNYKNNKDVASLTNNTTSYLNTLLLNSTRLNCVRSAQNLRGVNLATKKYIQFLDEHNELLFEKVEELETQISALEEYIKNNERDSTNNLEELKNSINSEKQRLDAFAVSYQNQMVQDQKDFSTMSDNLKNLFITAQEERKNTFDSQVDKLAKQQIEILEAAEKQRQEIQNNSEQLIKTYDEKFKDFEKQVENIVGIVNTNMFSYKYKEVADDAHKRAKFWHGVAVVLMVLVSIFAIYAFIISASTDTSWVKLVAKIFATTTLVTGAAYAARQASKQEKVERYARKIEMELVAIDPFIASLNEEKRSIIKEEISRKIFGNADAMEISNKDKAYTVMDKLSSIEDIVMSIVKKL